MTKTIFLWFIAVSMLTGGTLLEDTEPESSLAYIQGTVTNVVDGDTVDVKMGDGAEERVRLLLIDTPETKHPRLGVQPFGPEASAFTEENLDGQEIELELDVSERDRYGRVLAYIWLDGELFNEELVRQGLARVAIYPPDIKYVDRFEEVQKEAQHAAVGIWSIEDYVSDRGFDGEIESEEEELTQEEGCLIKGNINSSGNKIYHEPYTRNYEQTIPEAWFCTVEEAEAAGFRAPRN
ncbi:thermonuclease family protein [Jeotgalibacillus soli]|uniref:Thermonuclease n=1 Tax=Jeotgalibacillus soli TaxID=889306 RepID=A0A0C2VMI6_9BACL|nr:thermonuclease family protein [Jeotgalibacillus soli]KIL45218.1 thermonuclease [Jeotgalibacillus soli]